MANATWNTTGSGDYGLPSSWTDLLVPGGSDTAFFGTSSQTTISVGSNDVGGWTFEPWSSVYTFNLSAGSTFRFLGDGITVNGGGLTINVNFVPGGPGGATLSFFNHSTAGPATIANNGTVEFRDGSSAGHMTYVTGTVGDDIQLNFRDHSSAGAATITTGLLARTEFFDFANAGAAALITAGSEGSITGGIVDFSNSRGPGDNHQLTVGSIAGGGFYLLGANRLIVGSDGHSTTVSGFIEDGGDGGGSGASLVKVGHGTLTLSGADNSFSGGIRLEAGALDLGAIGAAGPGAITFAGRALLRIANAALSAHQFGNPIDAFARHDVLDLTGLKFHHRASATYHGASHHLAVHSGGVTDTLTLNSPHGTHFEATNDGHGGTEVFLVFA